MKTSPQAMLLPAVVFLLAVNPCALAHTDITAHKAKDLIDTTPDLIIVDVREPHEYCDARGRIPAALNYPWSSGVLSARFEELLMDRPILVVCRSGGRANAAANFLDSRGFSMIYDMLGGMNAWKWETEPCKYSGGSGTAEDPYQIATAEDLNAIGADPNDWNKHFELIADIDLSRYKGTEFNIIGDYKTAQDRKYFTGVFDGAGHTISNFVYVSAGNENAAIFDTFDGSFRGTEIRDLGLVDPNVHVPSGSVVSALVSFFEGGAIRNCYVRGGRITGGNVVGGLVGYNFQGHIANCYASTHVSGDDYVGGLVADNLGDLQPYASGLINCYSTSSVSGNTHVGGLMGSNLGDVFNCFWDVEASGQEASPAGVGKITNEMQTASTFLKAGWDLLGETANGPNDIWWILEGRDYPRLWWEYPGHVFEVEIALGLDYEDPDDPNDKFHEFELTVVTDGSIQRVSFVTPSGGMYKIPDLSQHERPVPGGWLETAREYDEQAGVYEWSYELKLEKPKILTDFGDGSYEIITYYQDGTQQQTAAWFGIPGTEQPIPELVQEPVLTSFADGDTLAPPASVEWVAPTDPAMNRVLVELSRQDAPERLDFDLDKSAYGIDEPLSLSAGTWAVDLVFAARHEYKNSDFVKIRCLKYTESGYTFTIEP